MADDRVPRVPTFVRLKAWAATVRRDTHAVALAARDPRVPWYAKLLAGAVVAYLASPIDLIPDFIPVLGYLDDLLIVPLGLLCVIRLIPEDVMAEHRATAERAGARPASWSAAAAVVATWILTAAVTAWLVLK